MAVGRVGLTVYVRVRACAGGAAVQHCHACVCKSSRERVRKCGTRQAAAVDGQRMPTNSPCGCLKMSPAEAPRPLMWTSRAPPAQSAAPAGLPHNRERVERVERSRSLRFRGKPRVDSSFSIGRGKRALKGNSKFLPPKGFRTSAAALVLPQARPQLY